MGFFNKKSYEEKAMDLKRRSDIANAKLKERLRVAKQKEEIMKIESRINKLEETTTLKGKFKAGTKKTFSLLGQAARNAGENLREYERQQSKSKGKKSKGYSDIDLTRI